MSCIQLALYCKQVGTMTPKSHSKCMCLTKKRVSIFRSTGFGLKGTLSHLRFTGGVHGRAPSAPTELEALPLLSIKIAQWWPGHVLLAVAPVCMRASPGIVW
uniref:Uncharacterized protein n=1 Tax=Eutreptiella gymnastica TaxID=73025 RepID=A0A7S4LBX3_9EUGL